MMCDDITCDDLHLASVAGMDDITFDDLIYHDINPNVCEIGRASCRERVFRAV